MEKKTTVIRIGDREYKISGNDSEEYVEKIAMMVDKQFRELRQTYFTLDFANLIVLTALNIAEENIQLSEEIRDLNKRLDKITIEAEEKIDEAFNEAEKLRKQVEVLRSQKINAHNKTQRK